MNLFHNLLSMEHLAASWYITFCMTRVFCDTVCPVFLCLLGLPILSSKVACC